MDSLIHAVMMMGGRISQPCHVSVAHFSILWVMATL